MNFFLDAHVFDDTFQGSRTYLKGLYAELVSMYRSVNFFIGAYDTDNLKKEFGIHENITFIKYWSDNKFIRLLINIPFIIIRNKIEISHFQYIVPFFRFSKEILTIHDVLFLDYPELFPKAYRIRNKFLFKHSARRADFLLTVSEYSRRKISEHFRIKEKNIYLIPNGVADDFFQFSESTYDIKSTYGINKYLLYVSRMEPRKNHKMLVEAFADLELWKDGYSLVFIGKKALPCMELDVYMQNLPAEIRAKILIIDGADSKLLKAFYKDCSLFVYPSLAEGFGIPPLEAIASGAPVVCSNSTAMEEFRFLKDRLFNPESLDDLKVMILRYLNGNRNDMSEAIKHVRRNYCWKNSAKIFGSIILNTDCNMFPEK